MRQVNEDILGLFQDSALRSALPGHSSLANRLYLALHSGICHHSRFFGKARKVL